MNKCVIILGLVLISFPALSQQKDALNVASDSAEIKNPEIIRKDNRPWSERLALGCGSSFWINVNQTYIELSPVIAYRFPKRVITGVGYRYIYRHERLLGRDLNAFGPDIFARANLLKRVYFWTEYEILRNQYLYGNDAEAPRLETTTDSWFAGLGYIRTFGRKGRGGVSVQLLYNFLYSRDDLSPYYAPVTYRVGYYF